MVSSQSDTPPRPLLIAALVVAIGAVVVVLVVAAVMQRPPEQTPVVVAAAPAPAAESPECIALGAALPERLGEFSRATLREPAPAGAAAWRAEGREEPIILRCGLDRPLEFVVGAPIQVVDSVEWFRVADEAGAGRSTWFAVDRPVYVALTLPAGSGPAPIQALSQTISQTLASTPVQPAPVG